MILISPLNGWGCFLACQKGCVALLSTKEPKIYLPQMFHTRSAWRYWPISLFPPHVIGGGAIYVHTDAAEPTFLPKEVVKIPGFVMICCEHYTSYSLLWGCWEEFLSFTTRLATVRCYFVLFCFGLIWFFAFPTVGWGLSWGKKWNGG